MNPGMRRIGQAVVAGIMSIAAAADSIAQCPGTNDCCVPSTNGTGGCTDAECCESICNFDSFCCDTEWDAICAWVAGQECALCGAGGCSGNDCCEPAPNGTGGCNDAECCELICFLDPSCCETHWDSKCADAANQFCIHCKNTGPACPSWNDCCVPSQDGSPGCSNPRCCSAVCDVDSSCCRDAWDQSCATLAAQLCACESACPPSPASCFEESELPGCSDVECCTTVCPLDSWCCQVMWDCICASEALQWCAGVRCASRGADFNCDGCVNGNDLGSLLGAWGDDGGLGSADLNCDGTVNGDDLGDLLGAWNADDCGP